MSTPTHITTADRRVRYRIERDGAAYLVTRCRYDGVRWLAQVHDRMAARSYEAARGLAATLAAREGRRG